MKGDERSDGTFLLTVENAQYTKSVSRGCCLFFRFRFLPSGVEKYGKVAIIANNRWEWATIAAAAYSMNATLVPMYEAQLPTDWTYILNDSGSSVVFCATQDIFDRVQKDVLPSTPLVKASLCLNAPEGEPHAFATAMAAAQPGSSILKPTEEDLANLIYTSGTTGQPKGEYFESAFPVAIERQEDVEVISHDESLCYFVKVWS